MSDTRIELPAASPPPHVLEVLGASGELPICATCATQYPGPRSNCELLSSGRNEPSKFAFRPRTTFAPMLFRFNRAES